MLETRSSEGLWYPKARTAKPTSYLEEAQDYAHHLSLEPRDLVMFTYGIEAAPDGPRIDLRSRISDVKRRIALREENAPKTFRQLIDWLGEKEVKRKLERVRLELQMARGLYLDNWVKAKNQWWMALEKAIDLDKRGLRFKGRIKEMVWPFETAAKMSALYAGMPATKREELRRRILGSGHVGPVLMEIDMAAHFWQMGFDVEWLEPALASISTYAEMIPFRAEWRV